MICVMTELAWENGCLQEIRSLEVNEERLRSDFEI